MLSHRILLPAVALVLTLLGCNTHMPEEGAATHTSCIQQPVAKTEASQKQLASVSANLEKISTSGSLSADFEKSVDTEFNPINDDNAALLLYLNAIDCYVQHGKVGEELARDLVVIVHKWWGAKNGFQGAQGASLSPAEKNVIDQSPSLAPTIYARFHEFSLGN